MSETTRQRWRSGPFAPAWRATTVGVLLTVTLIAFESMAVTTAMPTVVRELDALEYFSWPFTAFLVCNIVGMVAGGEWGDRVGGRPPLRLGLVLFTAGLAVAGTAGGIWVFVLGRVLQGLGGGLTLVATFLIIGVTYPSEIRPRVFAALSAAWVLPSLIGPIVAGSLADHATWRLVFLGLVPFTVLGTALLLPTMRRLEAPERPPPRDRVRVVYAVCAGGGIGLAQWAFTRLGSDPDVVGGAILVLGGVLLVFGLRRLLPRGTASFRRGLPSVVAFRGMLSGAFFTVGSLLPLTLSTLHGYSTTAAGLPLLVGSLGWSLGSAIQGRWSAVARYRFVRTGFLLVSVGALGMVVVAVAAKAGWAAFPLQIAAGLGMGFAMASVSVLLLDLSPEVERGANTAAMQISDVALSAICVSLGGGMVAAAESGLIGFPAAVASVTLAMGVLAGAGVVLAGRARGD